jgi:lactoylglutathione lyase
MSERARFVGINHVALEVGDIDQALKFYGRIFDFELRGRIGRKMAFLDTGDHSIARSAPRRQGSGDSRHLGFVLDDSEAMRCRLRDLREPRLATRLSSRANMPWPTGIAGGLDAL